MIPKSHLDRKDAHGNDLWTSGENWTKGLPHSDLGVEIGDDHSGRALHCVIPEGYDAVCHSLELAEHARTQGTTLRIEKGASLTIRRTKLRFASGTNTDQWSLKFDKTNGDLLLTFTP